jgi:hypothetical protein
MSIYVYLFNTFPFPKDDQIENYIVNSDFQAITKENLKDKFTDELLELLSNIFNKSPL